MKLIKIPACRVGHFFIFIFWCFLSLVVHKVRARCNCMKVEPQMITSPLIPPPSLLFSFSLLVQLSRSCISYFINHKRKNTPKGYQNSNSQLWELAPNRVKQKYTLKTYKRKV